MVGVDAVAADHHGFNHGVGVSLHDGAVHECTGVSFIGITNYVFIRGVKLTGYLPLHSGGETCAAAATEAGGLYIGQNLKAVPLETLSQGLVSVTGNVFTDVLRIDETAVTERHAQLLAVEVHVLGV